MRRQNTIERSRVAQSEVIGVIIILGITFTGISIILVTGNPTLDDTKDLARTSTAENGLSLLDERVSSAALSGSEKKQFTLNLQSGELSVSPEGGNMRIYSAPAADVWSRDPSPGASGVVHVLNFTVEGGSELVGNDTNPRNLDSITVRYPTGFDVGGVDGDHGFEGIDSNIDGNIDKPISVDSTSPGSSEFVINFDGGTVLNETDMITIEYDDIDQPSACGGRDPNECDVNVTVENDDGDTVTKETTVEIGPDARPPVRQIDTEVSMGKIEYETTDSVIGYQNGGVWTKPEGEDTISRTISKPEVYYDGNTLTASIINITNAADIALGGTPSMTATNTRNKRVFPVMGTERTNPLNDRNVYVEVNTSYYNGWSNYFERETVGDVVDVSGTGGTRTVRVELSPLPDTVYNQAIVATKGELTLANTTVDSYDSSVSDYSPRYRFGNANTFAEGNITLENETGTSALLSRVYGDVLSNDRVVMQNRTVVNGSVKARGYPGAPGGENITLKGSGCRVQEKLVTVDTSNADIGAPDCGTDKIEKKGNVEEIESLPKIDLVDSEIQERVEEYSNSPNYLPDGSSTSVVNVSAGNYYVDDTHDTSAPGSGQLDWSNKKIRFETDGGPINIAIKNGTDTLFQIRDTEFEVEGDNPVRVYSGNMSTSLSNFPKIEFQNITMDTRGSRTDLFTVFLHSTRSGYRTNVTMKEGTEFYGTLYAPDSKYVQVAGSEVHGAMVVGEADIVDSGVHYDQQLRDPAAEGTSAVNYLHVTDNRVRVR